jgi:hypothetical protein
MRGFIITPEGCLYVKADFDEKKKAKVGTVERSPHKGMMGKGSPKTGQHQSQGFPNSVIIENCGNKPISSEFRARDTILIGWGYKQ